MYLCGRKGGLEKCTASSIHIKLLNEEHEVSFFQSMDGVHWEKLGITIETSGYHHNVFEGFVSLRAGLYAAGKGRMIISEFTYRGVEQLTHNP